VAEWPAKRIEHLRALAISRAIENQTYVAVCNGVGKNGDVDLGGHSLIISPDGKVLCEAGTDAAVEVVTMHWSLKEEVQRQFRSFTEAPFHLSAPMKMGTPEACAEDAEKRCSVGQRVIFIRIDVKGSFAAAVDLLECARQQGDHLVVAAELPENECQKQNTNDQQLLTPYAALGCVGTIFSHAKMTVAIENRLKRCSCLVLS
jgi:hypothetical protein